MELITAVKEDDISSMENLISSGADLNRPDSFGWTALSWAAAKGKLEIVKLLLERGANPHATGRDQRKASKIALAAGHVEVAAIIRAAGADRADRTQGPPPRRYCRAYPLGQLRSC
jgi:ankyrin repeat protein